MTTFLLLLACGPSAAADFNPKDLDNLEFFVESVKGLALATHTSEEAYAKTGENTPLEKISYCTHMHRGHFWA